MSDQQTIRFYSVDPNTETINAMTPATSVGAISGRQVKEKLPRLAQQAQTINSCVAGP